MDERATLGTVRYAGWVLVSIAFSVIALGCAQDWGDDHLVVNELELLGESDLWVHIGDTPATPVECSFAICQNVVRGVGYEVIGDVGEAKVAALVELMEKWVPTSDVSPFTEDSAHFQLRDGIEIDTSTRTAFLRVQFLKNMPEGPNTFVANAIAISVSSDSEI